MKIKAQIVKESPLARIRKVIGGANELSTQAEELMTMDVERTLCTYFDITPGSTTLEVTTNGDGSCNIIIKSLAERVKNVKIL